MDDSKAVAVIQASIGGFDGPATHVEQSVVYTHYMYAGEARRLPPRLEAKIPKMFGWQLNPNYDYYLWLDGNISLNNQDTLKFFIEQIQDSDIVVIRHHRRPNIRQEVRYLRKGLREQSIYLVNRYNNELWQEQYEEICRDKEYVDDLLVLGGIFMYRNTPEVQAMFKEWWYHVSRYNVQDQISFAYVLKKSGIRVKVIDQDYTKWELISHVKHKIH
jgi:hypothetical protein